MSFIGLPYILFCFFLICICVPTALSAAVKSTDRSDRLSLGNLRLRHRFSQFDQSEFPKSDQPAPSRPQLDGSTVKEHPIIANERHHEHSRPMLSIKTDDSDKGEDIVDNSLHDDVGEGDDNDGDDDGDGDNDGDDAADNDNIDDNGGSSDGDSQDGNEDTTDDTSKDGSEPSDGNGDGDGSTEGDSENNENSDSENANSAESDPSDPTVLGQSEGSDADTSNETSQDVSGTDEAFAQFMLLQLKQGDGEDDSFKTVTLFENGTLTGPFANNPNTSDISSLDAEDKSLWFNDSDYNDRIAFQFQYDLDLNYSIEKPTIFVAPGSGIEPQLDFQVHQESGTGTLTVFYHCVMGKPGEMLVGFSMRITSEHSFDTSWVKICGQGRFEHVDFGFLNHESQFVPFNVDGTFGDDERKKLEVGPIDSSTDLQVGLKTPATYLEFSEPYIMSDSEDISVKLRTTISSGSFVEDTKTKFTVLYDCVGKSTGNVKFTVGIPPWENITATWRKDCGGSVSQALLIGTSGEQSFDVMQEGNLKPEFDVTDVMSVASIDDRVKVFPTNIHSQKFFLTNSDDTSDIHFQKVSITLSDPNIMKVVIGNDRSSGSLGGVGGVLERDSFKALDLFFICSQEGKSVVLVTLPTVRYKSVEFGFVKDCEGPPKVYEHSGFMSTAGSLLDAILVLAVVGGIAFCIYNLRKRKGTSYSPVATSEQTA